MPTQPLGRWYPFAVLMILACGAGAVRADGPSPFADAIAVWHLTDGKDAAGADSPLTTAGDVKLGIPLDGPDREASVRRGGDRKAAELSGGHLLAGQVADGELNPAGGAFSLCIRLRDTDGKWDTSLFSKHGGHGKLVYNLFTYDLPANGPGLDLGFELGTERGMAQVKVPLANIGPLDGWHDVIVRYTGERLELYVDGVLVDATAARGRLRQGNAEPCVLGGESNNGKVARPFRGMVDHAALWGRALTDDEIVFLSGGADAVAQRRKQAQDARDRHERELEAKIAADPHRPAYHFLPPRNWMNDPNGLIHINGDYHLFYQYNPFGSEWGHMTWGHAVSKDLVRWRHLPHALHPDQPCDKDGVFSGCAVNNNGTATILYTGTAPEVQCVAVAKDKDLIEWTKPKENPVIPGPPKGLKVTGFRDPCVWREGDTWNMVVGSGIEGVGGAILLYRSKDLVKWDYVHPAFVGDQAKTGTMWECPALFPLGDSGKWVLALSPIPGGRSTYFIGTWDNNAGKFTPDHPDWHELDPGGCFYAPQLFKDERGRLIMFGWLKEDRRDAGRAGWQGVQSLPRVVSLGKDGRLHFAPAAEVGSLRAAHVRVEKVEVTPDTKELLKDVRGDRLEIVAEIDPGAAEQVGLTVRASPGGEEETRIVFDRKAKRLSVDRTRSSTDAAPAKDVKSAAFELAEGEPLKLRVFVDRSVIEVFANGHTCLTSRVYPARADSVGVGVYAKGGKATARSLDAWGL